jgi:hypothetical protein
MWEIPHSPDFGGALWAGTLPKVDNPALSGRASDWKGLTMTYRWIRAGLAGAALVVAVAFGGLAGTAAARESTFDVGGTVHSINGSTIVFITSDVNGRQRPITIDVSQLRGLQIKPGDPLKLTIRSREFDSYLAIRIVRESPYVSGEEFGIREEFTVKQSSIQAGVGNVPEDDEALAKQDRDHNLRKNNDDDDDDNEPDEKEEEED